MGGDNTRHDVGWPSRSDGNSTTVSPAGSTLSSRPSCAARFPAPARAGSCGERFPGSDDFDARKLYDTDEGTLLAAPFVDELSPIAVEGSALLHWLWEKAQAEWS